MYIKKEDIKMVKNLVCFLFLLTSFTCEAIYLDNSSVYTVPKDERWIITDITRNSCDICTADIYVQSGSVRINGIWVYGEFQFSILEKSDILFDSNAVFSVGDVVKNINITNCKE